MEQKGECHRDESSRDETRRDETRLNWCRRWGYLSFCAVLLSLPRDGALSEKVTTRFRFPHARSLSLPRLLIVLVCPPTKLRILLLTSTSEQVLLSDKEEEEEEDEDEYEDVALLPASALVGIDDVNVAAAEEGNIIAAFSPLSLSLSLSLSLFLSSLSLSRRSFVSVSTLVSRLSLLLSLSLSLSLSLLIFSYPPGNREWKYRGNVGGLYSTRDVSYPP